ncbi:MAG: hypothetical protein U0Q16_30995 [Bryobacteraceae bacterium]
MHTLLIAAGDARHGDEAVARRVLELIDPKPDVNKQDVSQLSDGLARDIAGAQTVMFIDPAHELGEPWLEPAGADSRTGSIVNLARALYRFQGEAFVCYVPGLDFSEGAELSPYAEQRARQAADLIRRFLAG